MILIKEFTDKLTLLEGLKIEHTIRARTLFYDWCKSIDDDKIVSISTNKEHIKMKYQDIVTEEITVFYREE